METNQYALLVSYEVVQPRDGLETNGCIVPYAFQSGYEHHELVQMQELNVTRVEAHLEQASIALAYCAEAFDNADNASR